MTIQIGVTGAKGQVGTALLKFPNTVAINADVRDALAIESEIKAKKPNVIVHLAAITDVNTCEIPGNRTNINDVNVRGTFNVSEIAEKYDCGVVLLSSFQVFDGKKWFGNYTEKDNPNPINYYGMSKMGAESFHGMFDNLKVVRTSYLFDYVRLFEEIEKLEEGSQYYPTFMTRSFMHVHHFCELLYEYCTRFSEMPKILHLAGCDTVSWYQFMSVLSMELGTMYDPFPRRDEDRNEVVRPYKGGLNTNLSRSLKFRAYDYLQGIEYMVRNEL